MKSEGSPPVSTTWGDGQDDMASIIPRADISVPSSCLVSQKGHSRLHPENLMNTEAVPVKKPSPCRE
jgi:hypothetical protein